MLLCPTFARWAGVFADQAQKSFRSKVNSASQAQSVELSLEIDAVFSNSRARACSSRNGRVCCSSCSLRAFLLPCCPCRTHILCTAHAQTHVVFGVGGLTVTMLTFRLGASLSSAGSSFSQPIPQIPLGAVQVPCRNVEPIFTRASLLSICYSVAYRDLV